MILPGSYANGFAPRDGRPLYPELWRGCVGAWAPCLGPTGVTLLDWSGLGNHGTLTNLTASAAWTPAYGRHSVTFSGGISESVVGTKGALTSAARPLTISFWYRASSVSAARHWVYSCATGSSNPNFAVTIERISDSSHRMGLYTGSYTYSSAFTWDLLPHHYAISWLADNTLSFYRDGMLLSSTTAVPGGISDVTWQWSRLGTGNSGFSLTGSLIGMMTHSRALRNNELAVLASRPGIAYEMAPRRRSSSAVQFNRRRRLLLGVS